MTERPNRQSAKIGQLGGIKTFLLYLKYQYIFLMVIWKLYFCYLQSQLLWKFKSIKKSWFTLRYNKNQYGHRTFIEYLFKTVKIKSNISKTRGWIQIRWNFGLMGTCKKKFNYLEISETTSVYLKLNPIHAGVLENQDTLGGAIWPSFSKSQVWCTNMIHHWKALMLYF